VMRSLVIGVLCLLGQASAHNSYTGGYSGAPGKSTCAVSCHGGSGGTLVVTGFPSSSLPGQTYRITLKRSGGSSIVNFNATTRLGVTSVVAGTFAPVLNSALYTGADGGVYASPHAIDSAVFQWTAPPTGSGTVNFYAAAFQGSTTSSNGQSKTVTSSATEVVTGIALSRTEPAGIALNQNYPNPFNPKTAISYQLSAVSWVTLKVFDAAGKEVTTLVSFLQDPGSYTIPWNGAQIPSGTYFYRLTARPEDGRGGELVETRKMILLK
jgi:hypothetical protein